MQTQGRGRPCKGLSRYLLLQPPHHLVSSICTNVYPPTFLFRFQNLTALIFKLFHFYIFSILITYCIILSRNHVSWTLISLCRLTSLDLFIIHIMSSPMLFWHELLNLVVTCALSLLKILQNEIININTLIIFHNDMARKQFGSKYNWKFTVKIFLKGSMRRLYPPNRFWNVIIKMRSIVQIF